MKDLREHALRAPIGDTKEAMAAFRLRARALSDVARLHLNAIKIGRDLENYRGPKRETPKRSA